MDPVQRVLHECASVYPRYSASFVDAQVRQCISVYPTLSPRVFVDQTTHQRFMSLFGTIPVYYGNVGATFHIPIEVVLPSNFPQLQPAVFVRPTPQMMIPSRHRHASAETGFVYCEYLSEWTQYVGHPQRSPTLLMLCRHLCQIFSLDPPVRQRPPDKVAHAREAALRAAREEEARAAQLARQQEEEAHERMIKEQSVREAVLQRVLQMMQQQRQDLFIESSKVENQLPRADATYSSLLSAVQAKQNELERLIQETDELKAEVQRLRQLEEEEEEFDIDEYTNPSTSLHGRIVDCVASDAAIDDVMYIISNAVSEDVMELHAFTRAYRNLAKQKFQVNSELREADVQDSRLNKHLMEDI